jgi:hypothetical protein
LKNLLLNIFGSPGYSERNTFNKNLTAFLVCLFISTTCWFLIILSRDYKERANFKVIYANLPQDKALINRLPDSLQLDLITTGFALLRERVFGHSKSLDVDCSKLRTGYDNISYLPTAGIGVSLASQLGAEYTVTHIYPDTLFFNFGAKASKEVPVRLNAGMSFEKQYQLSDSIRIVPSRVIIYGARETLDRIEYLNTEYVALNKMNGTQTLRLGFAESGRGLGFSADSVTVTVPVDRFTEGNTEVTVQPINLPPGIKLKLFPEKVSLRYRVGISNLNRVNEGSFRVVVDFSNAAESGGSRLKPEVLQAPGFVNSITIDPVSVEYIIRKMQ